MVEIDLARLDLWAAQLILDAAVDDQPAFSADAFALDYVRDRIVYALTSSDRVAVNIELGEIQAAVIDEEMAAGAEAATRLRSLLAGIEPGS